MKNNGLKNAKAITLIALIVSIIVILILAGVSIAVLTGENGIINRTGEAKTTSAIARVEELANLELADSLIGVRAGLGETEKTLPEILTILEQRGDIGANSWALRDDVTITGFNFGETTEVTLAKGGSTEILTAQFTQPSGAGGAYYIIIEGKKYPISKENGRVTIGKTEIKTNSGSTKLTGATSTNEAVASATIIGEDENQIRIQTGNTKGTATITVSSGTLTPVNITVNVLDKYTVTVEAGANGTVSPSGEQEVIEGQSITVTATGNTSGETKYEFASWSDGTNTYTTSNEWEYTPTGDVTLTATFKKELSISDYGKDVIYNGNTYQLFLIDKVGKYSNGVPGIWLQYKSNGSSTMISDHYETTGITNKNSTLWQINPDLDYRYGTAIRELKTWDANLGFVAYLCNSENWNSTYVASEDIDKGVYAIGAVSAEMFCDSYNQIRNKSIADGDYFQTKAFNINGTYGYYYKPNSATNSAIEGYYYNMSGYYLGVNSMYSANYDGWRWISSPCAEKSNCVCIVAYSSGRSHLNDTSQMSCATRPAIFVPDSVMWNVDVEGLSY